MLQNRKRWEKGKKSQKKKKFVSMNVANVKFVHFCNSRKKKDFRNRKHDHCVSFWFFLSVCNPGSEDLGECGTFVLRIDSNKFVRQVCGNRSDIKGGQKQYHGLETVAKRKMESSKRQITQILKWKRTRSIKVKVRKQKYIK